VRRRAAASTLEALKSRLQDQHNRFYDPIGIIKLVADAKRDEDTDVTGALDIAVEVFEKINEQLDHIAIDISRLADSSKSEEDES
jgi:hypothetical protein